MIFGEINGHLASPQRLTISFVGPESVTRMHLRLLIRQTARASLMARRVP